jgi:hypothetical protein
MLGQKQMTSFLQKLEELDPNKPFGGFHAVMTGDFFQLPPVSDPLLYLPTQKGEDFKKGSEFYKLVVALKDVICFSRNRRTRQEFYAQLQNNVRQCKWDEETIKAINSRVDAEMYTFEDVSSMTAEGVGVIDDGAMDSDYYPIVVSRNKTRQVIYEANMKLLSEKLRNEQRDIPILVLAVFTGHVFIGKEDSTGAKLNSKTNKKGLTDAQFNYLEQLSDEVLDRMPFALYLYVGAYILFSLNLGVDYGIANGTRGRIVGWQFPHDTIFEEQIFRGITVSVPLNGVKPDCVFIQLANPNVMKRPPNQPRDLPPNVLAIPIVCHPVRRSIKMKSSTSTLFAHVTITQLPIRQAQVLTCYSVQGNQYKHYIIAEFIPSQFYIMFSRGSEGLESITLKSPITRKFVKDCKPNKILLEHVDMLLVYNQRNIAKFDAL